MAESGDAPWALTIADLLAARADDDHVGLVCGDEEWTWRQIVVEATRRAALLEEARVPGPFHVGVLLDNVAEYLFVLCAAGLGGAVVVGINSTRRGAELAADISHTDCQLILTDPAGVALLAGLDLGVGPDRVWDVTGSEYASRLDGVGTDPTVDAPVGPEDLYALLFTSGSSGAPKAVRMTQGRAARASTSGICSRRSVPYCAMPLFHGNALNALIFPAMATGATIVMRPRFSASAFLSDVRRYGCTYFSAIGRVLSYILATPELADDAENPLQFVLGPESSQPDMEAFERRFGCPVFSGYGSSENAIILQPAPGVSRSALGLPPPGQDVAIIDPATNRECPRARFDDGGALLNAAEAIGEIVGRNNLSMFEGYYNNDAAMAERTRDGWYWSGDLGYRDAAGVFWFAGRTADWIRVDGENFAAAPVERILGRFPGARVVVVYGVPDTRNSDDQVMAAIELDDGPELDPVAFGAFLADQSDLGTKWSPRYVRVVAGMPVTGTNKVDRKPLRAAAWRTTDPVWWRPGRRDPYRRLTDADVAALEAELAASGRRAVLEEPAGPDD